MNVRVGIQTVYELALEYRARPLCQNQRVSPNINTLVKASCVAPSNGWAVIPVKIRAGTFATRITGTIHVKTQRKAPLKTESG